MRRTVILWAVLLLTMAGAAPAPAAEWYFLAVFGSQLPEVNRAKYTHSFAVIVRVTGELCPGSPHRTDAVTISWLSTDGEVRVARALPELGKNSDLHTTLRLVLGKGERVSMWGPYQIQKSLYDRAFAQWRRLESGEVWYKAVDTGYPTARVSNCIHALSDIVEDAPRLRVLSPGWGEPASYLITREMLPWIVNPGQTYPWVADELGLGGYPIVRRGLDENPGAGTPMGAVQTLRHPDLARP
jgi:hypothetical protein